MKNTWYDSRKGKEILDYILFRLYFSFPQETGKKKNEGKNNKLKKGGLIVFLLLQKSDRRWKSNKPWRIHIAINKKAKVKDWKNTIRR